MADAKVRALLSLHQGSGSGSALSVVRLALGLARRGVDVGLICPPDSEVEATARAGGLTVFPLPLARAGRRANAGALSALLGRWPADLIDSHGSRDREALTWLGLTRRLNIPAIFTRRSYPRTSWLENWLAARVAACVVAMSEPVRDALRRHGVPDRKIVVIHDGVLLDRLDGPVPPADVAAWRARIGWEPSRRTVAIVARPKDQGVVLAALPLVRTPVRLVLVGLHGKALHGPLPRHPDRHAVVRLPFVAEVRPLYELVELALHPSRFDALPQSVLEALALGKPVIASRATGNAVIVRDGTDGRLVDPTRPAAWAEAIDELLRDPEAAARLGAAGRRRARADFSHELTLDRTVALYHSVSGHSG